MKVFLFSLVEAIMAVVANKYPKKYEPPSPIIIEALLILNFKNTKLDDKTTIINKAKDKLSFKKNKYKFPTKARDIRLAANPSMPSIQFSAFVKPTTHKLVKIRLNKGGRIINSLEDKSQSIYFSNLYHYSICKCYCYLYS